MRIENAQDLLELGASLVARIEPRIRRGNYAEQTVQSVAHEELEALDCELVYDPALWLDFIQSTSVTQKKHWFSDVPLILARNRNIQVQLLCWKSATTDIHAHAFCGAFRVMQGSSVHTRYGFESDHWLSDALGLGRLVGLGSEYLARGSVREIASGQNGLIHSLFHLDSPSLTLVVRTYPSVSSMPQLSFYHPGLAIYKLGLAKDEEVVYLSRLLGSEASRGRGVMESLVLQAMANLDAPRLVQLCLNFPNCFDSDRGRERLVDLVSTRHNEALARQLDLALTRLRVQAQIKAARKTVENPELRFFLALLLNVPDRKALFELVRWRFPERDPVETCAEWIVKLSKIRANAQAFMHEMAARAQGPVYRLGSRIAQRIPSKDSLGTVESWLNQERESTRAEAASNPLMDLPELEPVFKCDPS